MMGYKDIIVESDDKLSCKEYQFEISHRLEINLHRYYEKDRPSKRHKYRMRRFWDLRDNRHGIEREHFTLPDKIISKIIYEFQLEIQFTGEEG